MGIVIHDFSSYEESVPEALDSAGLEDRLRGVKNVLIKPNLVNSQPFPITTRAQCCKAVANYVRLCCDAEIIIAEGCGDPSVETSRIYRTLGYEEIAENSGIKLVDLNTEPLKTLSREDCKIFPQMHLPEIAFTHFIISVPVLKAHSLADITGAMKGMMGFAPPKYYAGKHGIWNKAIFHDRMHDSIVELNLYRTPDFSLVDGSVGLSQYHLGGPECDPPVKKLVAGQNPLEFDRCCAELLGLDWKTIDHLSSSAAAYGFTGA